MRLKARPKGTGLADFVGWWVGVNSAFRCGPSPVWFEAKHLTLPEVGVGYICRFVRHDCTGVSQDVLVQVCPKRRYGLVPRNVEARCSRSKIARVYPTIAFSLRAVLFRHSLQAMDCDGCPPLNGIVQDSGPPLRTAPGGTSSTACDEGTLVCFPLHPRVALWKAGYHTPSEHREIREWINRHPLAEDGKNPVKTHSF